MRVLLVEDEVPLAEMVRRGLVADGHSVEVVHDGIRGLEAASTGEHDVVVLDIMLPGLSGYRILERLRAAQAAGTMESGEASALAEAFVLISRLRLDHQVEQLRRGEPPDDFIDPKTLNPLARSYLREAFRAVASVQANLSAELSLGVRWS